MHEEQSRPLSTNVDSVASTFAVMKSKRVLSYASSFLRLLRPLFFADGDSVIEMAYRCHPRPRCITHSLLLPFLLPSPLLFSISLWARVASFSASGYQFNFVNTLDVEEILTLVPVVPVCQKLR